MKAKSAVLATLAYHDIFEYPLTEEEIHNYLIEAKLSKKSLIKTISALILERKIQQKNNLYSLKNRSVIFEKRKLRAKYSNQKLKRSMFYARLLALVPSIKFVGVSGSLSMGNSSKDDDIDLVIITSKNTLWTSRFLANLVLYPFKRKPDEKHTKNKACLNLFLDERQLAIKNKNLYTAHEICQLKLLWDRGVYIKFLRVNSWVKTYLPNWQPPQQENKKGRSKQATFNIQAKFVEVLLKKVQLSYMKSKQTTEQIGEGQLFFHPKDMQSLVLDSYSLKVKKLGAS